MNPDSEACKSLLESLGWMAFGPRETKEAGPGEMEPGVKPMFRQSKFGQDKTTSLHKYRSVPLLVEDSAAGLYYTNFSTLARGDRFHYYFEIRDGTGGLRATFSPEEGEPFVFKFIGEVPSYVLVPHIFFMFFRGIPLLPPLAGMIPSILSSVSIVFR